MKQRHGLSIKWRAFPLHPDTPQEGQTLEALFRGRMVDVAGMMVRLREAAAAENLPFGERTMTYNSRLAQELGKWAESEGKIKAYNDVVFQTYFAHGRNIGDRGILMAVSKSVGLDSKEAELVLTERRFRQQVDADWELSRQMGIRAVPTFVMNDSMIEGAQPEAVLDAFVRS